jgi:hypothetical protein
MVVPSDKEYIATKKIMLGKSEMNPDFTELADYIYQRFGAKPVNIIYDTIDNINHGKTPRLGICFEFAKDVRLFREGIGNFDAKKQRAIADKFEDIIKTV